MYVIDYQDSKERSESKGHVASKKELLEQLNTALDTLAKLPAGARIEITFERDAPRQTGVTTLWTSVGGMWSIKKATYSHTTLYIEHNISGFVDVPTVLDDEELVYDFPKKVPAYVKAQFAKIWRQHA